MLILDRNIRTLLSDTTAKTTETNAASIAREAGCEVKTFNELQDAVATISYYNSRHDIFLRGQRHDHRDGKGHSALEAKFFRTRTADPIAEIKENIRIFDIYSETLRNSFRWTEGFKGIQTTDLARWCLLQHYEICPTPVLDMTRSTRVAASFATWPDSSKPECDRFIYVLGMPHPTGSITVAYDENIALLNLRNLMPPTARRPHWQEGYLACTYPNSTHWDKFYRDKKTGEDVPRRNNFARRLLAKFKIPKDHVGSFWDSNNPRIPDEFLMPNVDPVSKQLRTKLPSVV